MGERAAMRSNWRLLRSCWMIAGLVVATSAYAEKFIEKKQVVEAAVPVPDVMKSERSGVFDIQEVRIAPDKWFSGDKGAVGGGFSSIFALGPHSILTASCADRIGYPSAPKWISVNEALKTAMRPKRPQIVLLGRQGCCGPKEYNFSKFDLVTGENEWTFNDTENSSFWVLDNRWLLMMREFCDTSYTGWEWSSRIYDLRNPEIMYHVRICQDVSAAARKKLKNKLALFVTDHHFDQKRKLLTLGFLPYDAKGLVAGVSLAGERPVPVKVGAKMPGRSISQQFGEAVYLTDEKPTSLASGKEAECTVTVTHPPLMHQQRRRCQVVVRIRDSAGHWKTASTTIDKHAKDGNPRVLCDHEGNWAIVTGGYVPLRMLNLNDNTVRDLVPSEE